MGLAAGESVTWAALNEFARQPAVLPVCVLLLVVFALRMWVNPDPRRVMDDHVMYIHATLGMGKTALAAHWARRVLHPYSWFDRLLSLATRRPLKPVPLVYSTFDLAGCTPLDLRAGGWPSERGAKIVIDEILLLESNDLLPVEWFSRGCTLARQLGQQVVLISQASRLPNRLRKFQGTVGTWYTMKGVSVGKLGRLVICKRATEPFVRRTKGFRADGQKTSLIWVPGAVFRSYNSRKIYGYTVDTDGSWIDLQTAANAAGVDNQGAAGPRAAQDGPQARPVGQGQRPRWHRPGGKYNSGAKRRV